MYLCIDIGATKTLIILINSHGKAIHQIRFATNTDQKTFFTTLVQQIRDNFDLSKTSTISVAIPGPVENNTPLWLGNLPWVNFDIATNLKNTFKINTIVENDANLACFYEAADLSGLSVYLTFSTGIGGGVVRDGHMDISLGNYEPGHTKYEWNGYLIEWEDFASAKAISELFGMPVTDIKSKVAWYEVAHRMSVGVSSVISGIRPDYIIIGGPLGLVFNKYSAYLRHELRNSLSKDTVLPKIIKAKRPMEAVAYGCYLYAKTKSKH